MEKILSRCWCSWEKRLVGLVVALASGLIFGAGTPARADSVLLEAVLADSDADGDGALARDEAPAAMLHYFDAADADGDGRIDGFEAQSWDRRRLAGPSRPSLAEARIDRRGSGSQRAVTAASMIERLDKNGDQQLSREEFPEEYRAGFERLDLDKNGYIDQSDALILDSRRQRQQGRAPPQQDSPSGGRTVARTVQLMDTNGDGVLQKREAPLGLQRQWDRFDHNGDGSIDMLEATRPSEPAPGS
jgi:Ca2+-binding EF-hand superfamily protein